jgi:hypothetical protein
MMKALIEQYIEHQQEIIDRGRSEIADLESSIAQKQKTVELAYRERQLAEQVLSAAVNAGVLI